MDSCGIRAPRCVVWAWKGGVGKGGDGGGGGRKGGGREGDNGGGCVWRKGSGGRVRCSGNCSSRYTVVCIIICCCFCWRCCDDSVSVFIIPCESPFLSWFL